MTKSAALLNPQYYYILLYKNPKLLTSHIETATPSGINPKCDRKRNMALSCRMNIFG